MTFKTNFYLKGHIRKMHEVREKKHECDSCEKTFFEENHLKIHIRTVHTKIKNYKCNYCEKTFKNKGNLSAHETVHNYKTNEHKCPQCDAKFNLPSSVVQHITKVHNKE